MTDEVNPAGAIKFVQCFELAMQVYEAGDYAEAAKAFEDLCGKYPRYSAADRNFYYASDSWEKSGAVEQARTGWSSFLKYFPRPRPRGSKCGP